MAYEDLDDAALDEFEEALIAGTVEVGGDEAEEESSDEGIDSEVEEETTEEEESNDADDTDTEDTTDGDTDTEDEEEEDPDGDVDDSDTDTDDTAEEESDSTDRADENDETEDLDDGQESTQEEDEQEDTTTDEAVEEPKFDIDEYNRLKDFHRKVTDTEIVINGVKTKPFTDPDKILKAQQASGGLAKKFEAIKGARTVVDPLKKRGLLEDTERFDLLMKVNDGDPEAIKELLKQNEVDPMELDMDEIKYERTQEASTDVDLMFKDALEVGEQYGVKDKVANVILKEWDDKSRDVFFEDSGKAQAISSALAEQMSNGLYDRVMATATQLKSIDLEGKYSSMNAIDMYNAAAEVVNREIDAERKAAAEEETKTKEEASKVEEEKKKLRAKREKEEYEAKAKAQEDKVNKARRKAVESTKKTKSKTTVSPKKYDPLTLEGDALEEFERGLMELYS